MERKRRQPREEGRDAKRARRAGGARGNAASGGDSVLFAEIWRVLLRKGWFAKPPPRRSLDSKHRYVRPGCSPNGEEGIDYLLGEHQVLAFYKAQQKEDEQVVTDGDTVIVRSLARLDSCDDVHGVDRVHEPRSARSASPGGSINRSGVRRKERGAGHEVGGGSGRGNDHGVGGDVASAAGNGQDLGTDRRESVSDSEMERNDGDDTNPSDRDLYVGCLVAFSPEVEPWLATKSLKRVFRPVGAAYIVARVCRRISQRQARLYEIRWLDTMFAKQMHNISIGILQRGMENYRSLTRAQSKLSWTALTAAPESEDIPEDVVLEDLEEVEEGDYTQFDEDQYAPTTLAEMEAVNNMRFDPNGQIGSPTDLYSHSDGTTSTRVRPEFIHLFTHSASSCFLAYIPLYFWKQVVNETNAYASITNTPLGTPVTLAELMRFVGILFFMSINDKGEYANYWGPQPEDDILNRLSSGLETVMSLRRFKLLRKVFSFRAAPSPVLGMVDPAARICPLLNLLKNTGGSYVDLGRNVALDESSIACRSKFGRHVIVFNKTKPTVNYRFHCRSNIATRLDGVISAQEATNLTNEMALAKVTKMRQLVLEVAQPLYGLNKIINMDNYYTSVQLLQALRLKGLYARGTVKSNSRHFPQHTFLDKTSARGDIRQGVSVENGIVAASWCDGNIVRMVSNADPSDVDSVERRVGNTVNTYPAPRCVKEYNRHMQGVDRLDQVRAQFSIADGHSYKKWHKKLALAFIDIARVNGYLTRRLVVDTSKDRDPHRKFMVELAAELISGKWVDAPSDGRLAFDAGAMARNDIGAATQISGANVVSVGSPEKLCTALASLQALGDCSRKRTGCVVCRWEDRHPTEKTDYCGNHNVCLCRSVYSQDPKNFMCPETDLTCWEKFHRFYVPNQLFSPKGNIRKLSELYKLKQANKTNDGPIRVVRSGRGRGAGRGGSITRGVGVGCNEHGSSRGDAGGDAASAAGHGEDNDADRREGTSDDATEETNGFEFADSEAVSNAARTLQDEFEGTQAQDNEPAKA